MTLIKLLPARWEAVPAWIKNCLFYAILEQEGSLRDQWGACVEEEERRKKKSVFVAFKKCHHRQQISVIGHFYSKALFFLDSFEVIRHHC